MVYLIHSIRNHILDGASVYCAGNGRAYRSMGRSIPEGILIMGVRNNGVRANILLHHHIYIVAIDSLVNIGEQLRSYRIPIQIQQGSSGVGSDALPVFAVSVECDSHFSVFQDIAIERVHAVIQRSIAGAGSPWFRIGWRQLTVAFPVTDTRGYIVL